MGTAGWAAVLFVGELTRLKGGLSFVPRSILGFFERPSLDNKRGKGRTQGVDAESVKCPNHETRMGMKERTQPMLRFSAELGLTKVYY